MTARVFVLGLGLSCFACTTATTSDGGPGTPDSGTTVVSSCSDEMPCQLTPGTMASSFIYPVGHQDPWLFTVPTAGQIINLKVTNDADFSPIHLQVSLLVNTPTATVAWTGIRTDTFSGNGKEKINIQVVAKTAGMYKVVVGAVGNDAADRRNPYYILLTLANDTDPNAHDRADATALMAGVPVMGVIGFQGAEDWFSINAPATKLLHIKLTAPAPTMMPSVVYRYELYGPGGTARIAEADESSTTMAAVIEENRAIHNNGGTWYVRVLAVNPTQADLTRPYTLVVDFLDEPDTHEPNDTFMTPTVVSSGQPITGYIASKADVDYYAISIPSAGQMNPQLITAATTMPNSRVTLELEVLAPDGMTLVCAGDSECRAIRFGVDGSRCGGDLATSHVVRQPGTYFVAVRDHGDQHYDTAVPYTITVDNPPEPDMFERYERNCDMDETGCRMVARAIPSTTGTAGMVLSYPWVDGYISYAGDEDWFRFDVPGAMGAPPGQNGDWRIQLELQKMGPSPVEIQAFLIADGQFAFKKGYGQSCMMPMQGACDPTGCVYPPDQNAINLVAGEGPVQNANCLVVFREQTNAGPLYFRITDLNHSDYDVSPGIGMYRFRLTFTAECPATSLCHGMYFAANNTTDLCGGRP